MFIKIPKAIIRLSLVENKYILPAYIFSSINANPANDDIVTTNIGLLVENFNPNEDNRKGYPRKYFEALKLLSDSQNIYDAPSCITPLNFSFKTETVGKEHLSKNSCIKYYFDKPKSQDKFIKLDSDEYFYFMTQLERINQLEENQTLSKKWNVVDLLNFYVYLKNQILFYQFVSETQDDRASMKETVDSLAQRFSVGQKTISKYVHQLEELKLIRVKHGRFNNKRSNIYNLNDEWKPIWQEIKKEMKTNSLKKKPDPSKEITAGEMYELF